MRPYLALWATSLVAASAEFCMEYNPGTSAPVNITQNGCAKGSLDCRLDVWSCDSVTGDGRGTWLYDNADGIFDFDDMSAHQGRLQLGLDPTVCLTVYPGERPTTGLTNGMPIELWPCKQGSDPPGDFRNAWYLSGTNLIKSQIDPNKCMVMGPSGKKPGDEGILTAPLTNGASLYVWECSDAIATGKDNRARWTHPPVTKSASSIVGNQQPQPEDRFALLHSSVGYDTRSGSKRAFIRPGIGMALDYGVVPTIQWALLDRVGSIVFSKAVTTKDFAFTTCLLACEQGIQTWELDFSAYDCTTASACGMGFVLTATITVPSTGSTAYDDVKLRSAPFVIAPNALSGALLKGLTLGNGEARRATDSAGGFIDCNVNMGEANSNGAFMAALLDARSSVGPGTAKLDALVDVAFSYFESTLWDERTGNIANSPDCDDVDDSVAPPQSYCPKRSTLPTAGFRLTDGDVMVGTINNMATATGAFALARYVDTYHESAAHKTEVEKAFQMANATFSWLRDEMHAFPRSKTVEGQCKEQTGDYSNYSTTSWRKKLYNTDHGGCHRALEGSVLVRFYRYTGSRALLDDAFDSILAFLTDHPGLATDDFSYLRELEPMPRFDGLVALGQELQHEGDTTRLQSLIEAVVPVAQAFTNLVPNSPFHVVPVAASCVAEAGYYCGSLRNPGVAASALDAAALGRFLYTHAAADPRTAALCKGLESLAAGSLGWITGLHIGIGNEHTSAAWGAVKLPLQPASMVTNGPGVFALPWRYTASSNSNIGKLSAGTPPSPHHPAVQYSFGVGINPFSSMPQMLTVPLGFHYIQGKVTYESTSILGHWDGSIWNTTRSGSPSAEAYFLSDALLALAIIEYERMLGAAKASSVSS